MTVKTLLPKSLLASLALLTLSLSRADAAIIVSLATPSTAGSIVITEDINFTITSAGTVAGLVFDEWVTSVGSGEMVATASSFGYSINSGSTASTNVLWFMDNAAATFAALTPNDGIIALGAMPATALNDIFTVKAGTYTFAVNSTPAGFNPQANQTFTGNAFLVDGTFNRMTANTSVGAVPEPSRALLLLGGLGALMLRRRRA